MPGEFVARRDTKEHERHEESKVADGQKVAGQTGKEVGAAADRGVGVSIQVMGLTRTVVLPRADWRQWDRRPVVVKLDEYDTFMQFNGLRAVRSSWKAVEAMPVIEVRDEHDLRG